VNSILLIAISLIIIILIFRHVRTSGQKENKNLNEDEKRVENINMNKEFLDIAETSRKKATNAIKVFNYQDLQLIRSMLYSCGINNYVEYENMLNIKGGTAIDNFNDAIIKIFQEDTPEAVNVFNDYLKTKKEEISKKEKIRNIAEFLIGGWVVSNTTKPELIEQ